MLNLFQHLTASLFLSFSADRSWNEFRMTVYGWLCGFGGLKTSDALLFRVFQTPCLCVSYLTVGWIWPVHCLKYNFWFVFRQRTKSIFEFGRFSYEAFVLMFDSFSRLARFVVRSPSWRRPIVSPSHRGRTRPLEDWLNVNLCRSEGSAVLCATEVRCPNGQKGSFNSAVKIQLYFVITK